MKTLAILIILLFAGCGGGGGGSSSSDNTGTVMTSGVLYPVDSGDKVIKTSDEARVTVVLSTDSNTTEVKLTDGSASII